MARRRGFDEPNYTQTPNLLFDLHLPDLKPGELKVLLVIVRDTFGWHRTATEPLSLSRLQDRTGLGRPTVVESVKTLLEDGLLRRREVAGGSYVYEAVITDQPTLLTASSKIEPPSSKIEPAASAISEPALVRSSNQQGFDNRTPVKESKETGKESPHEAPPEGEHSQGVADRLRDLNPGLFDVIDGHIDGDTVIFDIADAPQAGWSLSRGLGDAVKERLGVAHVECVGAPEPEEPRRRRRRAA